MRQWRLAKQRKRERKSCLACNPAQAECNQQSEREGGKGACMPFGGMPRDGWNGDNRRGGGEWTRGLDLLRCQAM